MSGWDFAKYVVDMVYSHWAVTAFFIFLMFPKDWVKQQEVNVYYAKGEEE